MGIFLIVFSVILFFVGVGGQHETIFQQLCYFLPAAIFFCSGFICILLKRIFNKLEEIQNKPAATVQRAPQSTVSIIETAHPVPDSAKTWTCKKCGKINSINVIECPECGSYK